MPRVSDSSIRSIQLATELRVKSKLQPFSFYSQPHSLLRCLTLRQSQWHRHSDSWHSMSEWFTDGDWVDQAWDEYDWMSDSLGSVTDSLSDSQSLSKSLTHWQWRDSISHWLSQLCQWWDSLSDWGNWVSDVSDSVIQLPTSHTHCPVVSRFSSSRWSVCTRSDSDWLGVTQARNGSVWVALTDWVS